MWDCFHRLVEADTDERTTLLAGLDPAMRREVEELLAAHQERRPLLATEGAPGADPASSRLGSTIGPYRLREQLGQGGMGTVYLAEQERPVSRRVALKLMRHGLGDPQARRRFDRERQALVVMGHPNIATAFDIGTTDEGLAWIAMELVAGLPIDAYCDRYRLGLDERRVLFRQVLRGIAHAHRKGVVHRDIKPSNLLVTVIDGEAVVKVIDFGIAKSLGPQLGEGELTELGALIGTPEYMSPEQADLQHNAIDPASDVYSLGTLLYRLLVGVLPFDWSQLRGAGYGAMRQVLCEQKPPLARQRFAALAPSRQAQIAALRGLEPSGLDRRLADFEVFLARALSPDPTRRYRDARDFAFALDRPATVSRPRHRAPAGSVVAAAALLGLLAFGFWTLDLSKAPPANNSASEADMAGPGAAPEDGAGAAAKDAPPPLEATGDEGPRIAVTVDDLPASAEQPLADVQATTHKLLAALERHGIRATGFVNSSKAEVAGERRARTDLLRAWLDAGHDLGNHTATHPSMHDLSLEDYQADVLAGEPVLHQVLGERGLEPRYFRHPYLRAGRSLDKRRQFETFLAERGYAVAPVTFENSDWLFARAYRMSLVAGDTEQARRVADAYLEFSARGLDFWEDITQRFLGRPMRHVFLIHINQLNADHFDRLAELFEGRGYTFIPLEEALEDPAYQLADTYTGPGGVSWLYRWATTAGERYSWRSEPEPPSWVSELFE